MVSKNVETAFREQLMGFNLEFLHLAGRSVPDGPDFGLWPGLCRQLDGLTDEQLHQIAGVPCLLACFADGGAEPDWAAVAEAPTRCTPAAPFHCATGLYAAGLLVWLWQLCRESPVLAGLCAGLPDGPDHGLAALGFAEIQRCAARAGGFLRARFSQHPRFWPDLLAAVRSSDPDAIALAGLSVIQVGLADPGRAPPRPRAALLRCADQQESPA